MFKALVQRKQASNTKFSAKIKWLILQLSTMMPLSTPTIPFSLLFMMSLKLANLWNFNKIYP